MKSFTGEMAGVPSARMEWRRVRAWRMRFSGGGARLAPEPCCPQMWSWVACDPSFQLAVPRFPLPCVVLRGKKAHGVLNVAPLRSKFVPPQVEWPRNTTGDLLSKPLGLGCPQPIMALFRCHAPFYSHASRAHFSLGVQQAKALLKSLVG